MNQWLGREENRQDFCSQSGDLRERERREKEQGAEEVTMRTELQQKAKARLRW